MTTERLRFKGLEFRTLESVRDGHFAFYGAVYDKWARDVFHFVHSLIPSLEISEDLTEEIFINAWKKLRADELSPQQYYFVLFQTAYQGVKGHLQKDPPVRKPQATLPLAYLPLKYQAILVLRYFLGQTPAETARILNIPLPYGKLLERFALKGLEKRLKQANLPSDPQDWLARYTYAFTAPFTLLENTSVRMVEIIKSANLKILRDEFHKTLERSRPKPSPFNPPKLARQFATIAVVLAVLFSSSVGAAYAAKGSLPGDVFYGFKLAGESVRLIAQSENEGLLHAEFALMRLQEINQLVKLGRQQDLPPAFANLKAHLVEIDLILETGDYQSSAEFSALLNALDSELLNSLYIFQQIETKSPGMTIMRAYLVNFTETHIELKGLNLGVRAGFKYPLVAVPVCCFGETVDVRILLPPGLIDRGRLTIPTAFFNGLEDALLLHLTYTPPEDIIVIVGAGGSTGASSVPSGSAYSSSGNNGSDGPDGRGLDDDFNLPDNANENAQDNAAQPDPPGQDNQGPGNSGNPQDD